MTQQYRVWECKIAVPVGAEFPPGFDAPPRQAAINAVEAAGIEVLECFSGWASSLSEMQAAITAEQTKAIRAEEHTDDSVTKVAYGSYAEASLADDALRKTGGHVDGDLPLSVALNRRRQKRCMFCGAPRGMHHIRCSPGTVNHDPYGQPPATQGT